MNGTCLCGCGQRVSGERRYVSSHRFGHTRGTEDFEAADRRAIAYYTGAADARNGRPRRVDRTDISMVGDAYTRGYDATTREVTLA